ncbi:hypothetical protein BDZ90DRAFT_279784 [Jaminaea rosea]|uniref:Tricalbin n=1 Tax=Jaminaea rosea TaxID=1569628 RepID=A0A316UQ45_9BASI|nr:hypothetical protein BDZ90DRAFT_279784 [Jaminaea rosea]PWN27432.1 hypothetical protein BDZ90DRAFT_279784 [Jaminaea rosea]
MSSQVKAQDHAVGAPSTGADDAPQPDSLANVTQKDAAEANALEAKLQSNEDAGARVMNFDEDATPEQKAAQAKAAKDKIKPKGAAAQQKADTGMGLASDLGKAKHTSSTIRLDDIDRTSKQEGQKGDGTGPKAGATSVSVPPDAITGHTGAARAMLGDKPPLKAGEEEEVKPAWENSMVSKYVPEDYLGRFWFDGAAVLLAVLTTYFLTRFGGGIFAMLIVGAFFTTYYNASSRRTRQRIRDDIAREMAKNKMLDENESVMWMNSALARFWAIYEPVLSATIISTVDAILVQNCPSFLDSIRLTTFTLGTKAPKVDFVRTIATKTEEEICMDWKFSFTPNDTQDLTVRQAAAKINPKIVLTVRVGRGFVGAGLPILVEDISFVGHVRLRMQLMSNFPHVQLVDVSMMTPPEFDYVLKPVGGDTFGFDIGNIPGLNGFIREQVHANLGPMLYYPNVLTINLEELMSGTPLDTASGVVQVSVWSARNLKGVKLGGGSPDPYVAVTIDDKEVLAKTKHKSSTTSPSFKETKFILVKEQDVMNGFLVLPVMDYNDHRPDSKLGSASFQLKSLESQPEQENISSPVILNGKERGQLEYSLSYYPVIKPEMDADGKPQPLPETRSGVVRLTVHQAKELPKRSGLVGGDVNPRARILLNGSKIKETATLKRTLSPIWEIHTEFLVTERRRAVIGVQVIDDHGVGKDPVISYLSVKLDDLLTARERQQDWYPLTKEGRLRMSAEWKPVQMAGSVNGGAAWSPPIGAVKVWAQSAKDLKNVELGGKSDPYVRLVTRGIQQDASVVRNNNLNPDWDEYLYSTVHSLKDRILVEVMDYENSGTPRSLGSVELQAKDFASETGNPEKPYHSTGRQTHKDKLHLGRGAYKGEINFVVEFLPAENIMVSDFAGVGNEVADKAGDIFDEPEIEEDDVEADAGAKKAMTNANVSLGEEGKPEKANGLTRQSSKLGNGTKAHKGSVDSDRASIKTVDTAKTSNTVDEARAHGKQMSVEEILKCQSGIIAFNLLEGNIAKKNARLEVLFDDGYWPSYTTEPSRTQGHATIDEVGEHVVKELDWSKMMLKLRTGKRDEDVFAEFQGNTKDVLERSLNKVGEFTLASDAGTHRSTIKMECRYIPCDVRLQAVESINNQGFLRVDLLSAKNLRAADRGLLGASKSSDPYVAFMLNGERIFKSKTIKKTLNPDWGGENLGEVEVLSRVHAQAMLEIYDWDQVGQADHLGECAVDLTELEPFESTTKTLPIVGKGAGENGTITFRMVFRPEFVSSLRGRKGTSLNLGRTFVGGVTGVGKVGVAGVQGVGKVGVAGVKGVGHVGAGVGKGAFGVAGAAGHGVGSVGRGVLGTVRGRRASASADKNAQAQEQILASQGEDAVPPLPNSGNASELPALPGGVAGGSPSHFRSASNASRDDVSMAGGDGTPSKKKRGFNPFHRSHKNKETSANGNDGGSIRG